MFHARIVSPNGSLYLAAETTPYDLENLRTHVHDLRATPSADTRVELRIDRPSSAAAYRRVSTFLQQLEAEGVRTSFSLSPLVEGSVHDSGGHFESARRRRPA
jgi:biopolymer transport protein ExbD